MGFGNISKTLEIDLSGSQSNEVEFTLAVKQEDGPRDTGAEIKFKAAFDSHFKVCSLPRLFAINLHLVIYK